MTRLLITAVTGIALCQLCLSQETPTAPGNPSTQHDQAPAESSQPAQPARVAPGSVIPVQLTHSVDAKKSKAGDEVDAKVTQDMKAISGEVVLAKDTKVVGHITEAQPRTKDQKESQVGIAFDHAVMQDGSVENLPMSIQAVIAQRNPSTESDYPENGGTAPVPSAAGGGLPAPAPGRTGGMGNGAQQPGPESYPSGGSQPGGDSSGASPRRSITANTQGIVGIPNYVLSTPGDAAQGSVVTSEKNNVKLETGTLMLLRVNQ